MILLFAICLAGQVSVRFCAVGDIMLDRGIRRVIENNSIDYPFEKIKEFIRGYDLAFGNLECPVSALGYSTGKIYCFRADTSFLSGPTNAGFNIFCLANNHIIDWGAAACLDTRDIIEKAGLYAVGAGENQSVAIKPAIIVRNRLKFALIASVGPPLKEVIWPLLKPGPAQASLDTIVDRIRSVRDSVDFVIVSMHWGTEYVHLPDKWQKEWAHAIIDAGADLLIGHHPHVLQSFEIYNDRLIAYSLGNFVFDQRKTYQRQSVVLSAVFTKGIIDSIALHPVMIDDFQPGLAVDTVFESIASLIDQISPGLNHDIIDDRILCLSADRRSAFLTPILRARFVAGAILVYHDRIIFVDNDGMRSATNLIEDGVIIDAEIITEPLPTIFALIGRHNAGYAERRVQYQLTDGRIRELSVKHTVDRPWKIEKGDIDGDSKPELFQAVSKMGRFTKRRTNRIQVFTRDGACLRPLWFSSDKEIEFDDMMIRDIHNDGLADLLVMSTRNNVQEIIVYQWVGSRFVFDRVLMTGVTADCIKEAFL